MSVKALARSDTEVAVAHPGLTCAPVAAAHALLQLGQLWLRRSAPRGDAESAAAQDIHS